MSKNPSSKQPPSAVSGKKQGQPGGKGLGPLLAGAALVVVVAAGVFALRPPAQPTEAAAPVVAEAAVGDTGSPSEASPVPVVAQLAPEAVAKAEATAKLGPRKQQNLPPIPFRGYTPPRSPEVVTAAYQFAAEHPEVLSYIPCFCGCGQAGHIGNHDCFVKSRAPNGDVTEWDEHGVECAVCIDVANRSRQMHASGASVRDIRAAIEKEFAALATTKTPTPPAPAAAHHD